MSGLRRSLISLPVLSQVLGPVCVFVPRTKGFRLSAFVFTLWSLTVRRFHWKHPAMFPGTSGNSVQTVWADKPIWLPELPPIKPIK